jgi:carbon monoxide dehydrogenase subunit G
MKEEIEMTKLIKTIHVNAPAEDVYNFIFEPENLVEIWPSLIEIKNVQKLPNGGNKYTWVYKMAGMRFEGTGEDIEVSPFKRLTSKNEGGIDSVLSWLIEAENGGTRVSIETEYKVPIPLLGKLAENIIVKQNEREAEVILQNLKAQLEG